MKIGVFDSGVGGITVLTELRARLSQAEFIYLGDTAHVPYGTKSPAQIEKLSADCAKTLKDLGIDLLVVACNTASSLAMKAIQEVMGETPVIGVLEPGVNAVLSELEGVNEESFAPVLVLATRATVNSAAYSTTVRRLLSPSNVNNAIPLPIVEQACPLLVPMIEEGWLDHAILHLTIREYVSAHVSTLEPGIALLGCTHYPWIQNAIQKALPGWKVVNSAKAVAAAVAGDESLLGRAPASRTPGRVDWIFTDPGALPAFAKELIRRTT